ncbi:hypothetical protein STVA_16520 [Allostella vacuolata]|nr:hypothetical protein STVA_16520 [Stella vacuolata]
MLFFGFLVVLMLAAALLGRLGVAGLRDAAGVDWSACMRWAMAGALLFFGIDHLIHPGRYLPMIAGFVPFPPMVVLATGLCEIAGGLGLLVPRLRRAAGWALAAYFVCVFPANLRNALAGGGIEGLPSASWYYWLRLAFQPLAVWWALRAAELVRWPGRSQHRHGTETRAC